MESETLSPTDPEVMRCPFGYYDQLHADERSAWDTQQIGWIVKDYDELHAVARNPKSFSSSFYGPEGTKLIGVSPEPPDEAVLELIGQMHQFANALFLADPPLLTRQKAIATKALNAARVRSLEPLMEEVLDELIGKFIDRGSCDFVGEFGIWFPLRLISHTLGCAEEDMSRFKVWTDHLEMGYLEPLDNAQRVEVTKSVLEFQDYMLPRIAARREQPTDDLLSDLVNTTLDPHDAALEGQELAGPRQLTDAELLTMTSQLLAAGNHTTTSLLANLMVTLIERPDVQEELRAKPELIPAAIDESLRLDTPLRCTYRISTADTQVGNTTIPAGQQVAVSYGAGNHDASTFPEPKTFDLHRPNVKKHLGFGGGPHFCVGSQLARTEARMAFETILQRMGDLQFGDTPGEPMINWSTAGWHSLPITFTKIR